jgi:protein-tyrosine phosphatase
MGARVLLVCTANICRSPAAAWLLAGRLGPSIEFESRGTHAIPGAAMCGASADWVRTNGGGVGHDQVSRQLALSDIRSATLILAATQRHQAKVIELRPSAQVRTFTLVQAARIVQSRGLAIQAGMPVDADLPDRLLWLTEELDAYRGSAARPGPESADDLSDPHQGARHVTVFSSLLAAVDTFCAPLLQDRPGRS